MKIVIDRETGTVQHITEKITKETSIKEFIDNQCFGGGINIPLLPSDCKGFVGTNTHTGFIVESLPQLRTIKFNLKEDYYLPYGVHPCFSNNNIEFSIYMPFIYWIIGVSNNPVNMLGTGICFSTERVSSEESLVGLMKFPNIHKDGDAPVGTFCLGDMRVDDNLEFSTCSDRLIGALICSVFNRDYFSPWDTGWQISALEKAVKKYCDTDRLQSILDSEKHLEMQASDLSKHDYSRESHEISSLHSREYKIAFFILKHDKRSSNRPVQYLYAWEKLSQELSIEDFLNVWRIPKMTNYSKIVEHVQNLVERITNG